jgi:homoserine kinase
MTGRIEMDESARDDRARVRVPCSTSNLGSGFDTLGLALDLLLEVEIVGRARGDEHELVRLEGSASEWPRTPDNRLLAAFDRGLAELGARARRCRFAARSEIPIARGLGSSGAATAAGLLLAAHLAGRAREPGVLATLVRVGCELEGHPDNSTAALAGGLTLALPHERGVDWLSPPLARELAWVAAWGATPLPTERARRALPASVPLRDAVENARRLPFLLEGLRTGDLERIARGGEDRLHVRHRLPLIRGGEPALAAAREAGAALATISGSGSALIAVCARERAAAVAAALEAELSRHDPPADARSLAVVHGTPAVA